ncbi:MAG: sugar-binding protein, partial [Polyangiaceae bacterium]
FLSLPKIKAHRFGVVSMSVKGMQGTVMLSDASPAFRQKWRMHRELNPYLDARKGAKEGDPDDRAAYVAALEIFAERMSDVLEIEAPDAVLAEGAPAMGGDGFQKLYPSAELVAIGGTHPILVDRVGSQFLGLWNEPALAKELGGHASSPLIETAGKRFAIDLDKPIVIGDGAELLHAARPVHFVGMAPFAIHRGGAAETRPRLSAPPGDAVIDGNGNDPAWAKAQPVSWDTDYAGNSTGIVTRVRAIWSKAGLTMLFELESADLNVDTSRPIAVERSKLYDEDCVELFLTPDPRVASHYYEIELGPLGHFFDIDVDRKAKREDTEWSAGLQIATTHDAAKRTATIEARITAPDVLRALAPGRELPLGLFRMDGKSTRRYLAWSPPRTLKPNFHVPESFGTVLLEP